ncbi:hypothetical protein DYB35_005546 [Aphanomyces astaci]|uniref:RNase H type-1 domain-containing protein n=2 Tax=Aphanomyces astaci TaxID=112090 RepID=A0A418DKL5_APHAT|nr:hypothetical protein DYB35_005546 [Aphanomyces astaci]
MIHKSTFYTPLCNGLILFDGAARTEDACGGSGSPYGEPLVCEFLARFLPDPITNNQAEYDGLLGALRLQDREVCWDSNLLILQLRGLNRFRHPDLRALYMEARTLAAKVHCTYKHRTQDENQAADLLSKVAPDYRLDFASRHPGLPLPSHILPSLYDSLDEAHF